MDERDYILRELIFGLLVVEVAENARVFFEPPKDKGEEHPEVAGEYSRYDEPHFVVGKLRRLT